MKPLRASSGVVLGLVRVGYLANTSMRPGDTLTTTPSWP